MCNTPCYHHAIQEQPGPDKLSRLNPQEALKGFLTWNSISQPQIWLYSKWFNSTLLHLRHQSVFPILTQKLFKHQTSQQYIQYVLCAKFCENLK